MATRSPTHAPTDCRIVVQGLTTPPWWLGTLVLLGYAVVAGGLGTVLVQRRDVG